MISKCSNEHQCIEIRGGKIMSLYLGKIHYWLFNKILWFEGLEEEIINLAKDEGLDIDSLAKEINEKAKEVSRANAERDQYKSESEKAKSELNSIKARLQQMEENTNNVYEDAIK